MKDRWRLWPLLRGGRLALSSHREPVRAAEDWSVAAAAMGAAQATYFAPGTTVGEAMDRLGFDRSLLRSPPPEEWVPRVLHVLDRAASVHSPGPEPGSDAHRVAAIADEELREWDEFIAGLQHKNRTVER